MYAKTLRKSHGHIIIRHEDGSKIQADTKQCCHCGAHFVFVKGSGVLRGFCTKCHDITCGKIDCCKCEPYEKKIELIEKGSLITL